MIIVFKASKEMILSNGFMVGDNVLFVMIILERKLLRLELVQLTIEKIALIKEKFRKIEVHIRVNLTIYRNTWNLNLVILFSWKFACQVVVIFREKKSFFVY